MKLQVFSVFDSAANLFLEPFQCRTIEEAIRRFRSTVNHPEGSLISEYPEDYTLFHLGEFDQETGSLVSNNTPHSLGVAVTFMEQVPIREADSLEDAHGVVARRSIRDAR